MNAGWPETTVYYLALMTVIGFPAMLSMWFVIHPFARFWRRAGAVWTYLSVFPVAFVIGTLMFLIRGDVLSVRYGVRLPLVLLGIPFVAGGFYIGIVRLRDFSLSATMGLPELSRSGPPARLVTTGIYARIRHPRYVEIGLVLAGIALMVNYLAVYITLLLYVPVIYLVVVLEERELRERFGDKYEEYCHRVSKFWPKKEN
jgi:protein-S-isoprenylcysteine O-methyltransferase Ste14